MKTFGLKKDEHYDPDSFLFSLDLNERYDAIASPKVACNYTQCLVFGDALILPGGGSELLNYKNGRWNEASQDY